MVDTTYRLIGFEVYNFWMFKHVVLDFSDLKLSDVIFVEGINHDAMDAKSNWTGKTTLMHDAFKWLIDGQYSRLKRVNDVVGVFDKYCYVRQTYKVGKKDLVLTRYRGHPVHKNHLTLSLDSVNLSGERVIESKKMFSSLIGINLHRFAYGVLFGADKQNMFELSPAARNKMLADIWDLEVFTDAAKICGKVCTKLDRQTLSTKQKIESLEQLIAEIEDTIALLTVSSETFRTIKLSTINNLKTHKEEILSSIAKKKNMGSKIIQTKKRKSRIRDGIIEIKRKLLESDLILAEISKANGRNAGTREIARGVKTSMIELDTEISDINHNDSSVGQMCESCGNDITRKGIKKLVSKKQMMYRKLLKKYSDLMKLIRKRKTTIDEAKDMLAKYNIDNLQEQLDVLIDSDIKVRQKIAELKLLQEGLSEFNNKLVAVNKKIKAAKRQTNPHKKALLKRVKRHEELIVEMEELKSSLVKLHNQFLINKFWTSSNGFRKLRNLILEDRVAALNMEFSKHLDGITSGSISGVWRVDRSTGDIVAELYDAVAARPKHFLGFSSAQRSKLNFAVDLAMAYICAPMIGHINIDERLDDKIDDVGFRKIITHLKKITNRQKLIFLISHNPTASKFCDAVLRISRKKNVSRAKLLT